MCLTMADRLIVKCPVLNCLHDESFDASGFTQHSIDAKHLPRLRKDHEDGKHETSPPNAGADPDKRG
jgi:hypothetical protein